MSPGFWFWLLYVVSVIFGGPLGWRATPADQRYWWFGSNLVVMILIALLGWGQWGPPIK